MEIEQFGVGRVVTRGNHDESVYMVDEEANEGSYGFKQPRLKLSWHNVSYTVKARYTNEEKKKLDINEKLANLCTIRYYNKQIIKNATGYCEQGDALFIMGSSGAGKTTLLNILSDQISKAKSSKFEGEVLINDEIHVTSENFGTYACYVTQDDYLFESFTCQQCIEFAAKLKLNLSKEEIDEKVEEIIESLSLQKCRNTIVGNEYNKGMSGGEKKRTSIAVEMITDPQILFLDEPTSGLDSFTAHKIVSLLVSFAEQGKTVVSTIHQPSSETFQMFPKLLLLMEGNTIFHGRTLESVPYFRNIGFSVPEFSNPSDYYLREFYVSFKDRDKGEKLDTLTSSYQREILPVIHSEMEAAEFDHVTQKDLIKNMHKVSWIYEFWILLCRAFYDLFKNPWIFKYKTIPVIAVAISCMVIFADPGEDSEGIRGTLGSFLFISALFVYLPSGTVLMVFSKERPIVLKECLNKTYGILSYSLSKSVVEIPFETMYVLFFSLVVYFMMGLEASFEKFLIFVLSLSLNTLCAMSLGLFLGSAITNEASSMTLQGLCITPILLLSGIPVNLGSVDPWISWFSYLSPIRYNLEIFVRNEFEGKAISSENPIDILQYDTSIGFSFCMLLLITVVYRILAIIFLKITTVR
ncbi:unnamed protein product [Moneuplotes crassus]|uniref:ABC transporter domain-containing protein n=1 Tax=Euplotes crassus TaxID=5936 RepID=A0AAD1X7Z8_EUPCR|nr:unnamed protein product [Moneuplotes crassus]